MKDERIYGLSILRIISMLGIIGLHILKAGGAFARENLLSATELPVSILYIMCSCSVDTFAMLTGYLYVDKPTVKYKNILKLIFTVLFYSAIITVLFMVFKPTAFNSILDIIKSFLPPLANKFWYITCYVLLFVLIPFINKLIDNLSLHQFKLLLILLILLTSFLPTFLLGNFFGLNSGCSTIWLIVCYLIGAYIKRCKPNTPTRKLLLIYTLCVVAVIGVSIIGWFITRSFSIYNILITYISPFILLLSNLSIILFSKIQLKNSVLIKTINFLSNSAFDTYIIHAHPLIFAYFIEGCFSFTNNLHFFWVIPSILGSIVVIYLICYIISYFKLLIFKITKIDSLFNKLGQKIDFVLKIS